MSAKPLNSNQTKKKSLWKRATAKVGGWISCFSQKSWKGAIVGGIIAFVVYTLFLLLPDFKLGINPVVDYLLFLILTCIICFLTYAICKWLFKIVRLFNPIFVASFLTLYIVSAFVIDSSILQYFILFEFICGCLIAFALNRNVNKVASIILIVVAVGANISVFYLLAIDIDSKAIEVSDEYWNQEIVQQDSTSFTDPSIEGSYSVKALFYGSGKDKRRAEYGEKVNIVTDSVDATPFFDKTSGFGNKLRKWYWGFDSKSYPINGRVWYPDGEGKFPLVLIVHGNHGMSYFSDPGYEYLGQLLASRGYIFVSVDENFINGSWMGDYKQEENFTRGWLLLKHLENWRNWSNDSDNPFFEKVDMDNISLIGHSRGGAAVAVAAEINKLKRLQSDATQKFDFNFAIKSIIQIAPIDTYNPKKEEPLVVKNTDYLLLHGSHDEDVYWMSGSRVYNRLKFTDSCYHFKSVIYIYRANHVYFNTSWEKDFDTFLMPWLINMSSFIDSEEQRQVAKVYISAFLDATLKGKKEYIPIFKDYRYGKEYLAKNYYINQFEDSNIKYIADFEEDIDVTTATVEGCTMEGENLKTWKENALLFRNTSATSQHNAGVYLGWDKADTTITGTAQYTINLSDDMFGKLNVESPEKLYFFLCGNDDKQDTTNFTIELATDIGSVKKELNDFIVLPPPLKIELSKNFLLSIGKDKTFERVLQYVELPLAAFKEEDISFNPAELKQIRFIFDKTEKGEIIIDKIGIK